MHQRCKSWHHPSWACQLKPSLKRTSHLVINVDVPLHPFLIFLFFSYLKKVQHALGDKKKGFTTNSKNYNTKSHF